MILMSGVDWSHAWLRLHQQPHDCGFSTLFTKALPFLVTWDLDEVANKLKESARFDMTT